MIELKVKHKIYWLSRKYRFLLQGIERKSYHFSGFCKNIDKELCLHETQDVLSCNPWQQKEELKNDMEAYETCFVVAPAMRRSVVTIPGCIILGIAFYVYKKLLSRICRIDMKNQKQGSNIPTDYVLQHFSCLASAAQPAENRSLTSCIQKLKDYQKLHLVWGKQELVRNVKQDPNPKNKKIKKHVILTFATKSRNIQCLPCNII